MSNSCSITEPSTKASISKSDSTRTQLSVDAVDPKIGDIECDTLSIGQLHVLLSDTIILMNSKSKEVSLLKKELLRAKRHHNEFEKVIEMERSTSKDLRNSLIEVAKDRDDAVNRVLEITDENEELEKNSTTLSGYAESIAVERDEIALQLESWKIEVCRLLDDEDENAKENWQMERVEIARKVIELNMSLHHASEERDEWKGRFDKLMSLRCTGRFFIKNEFPDLFKQTDTPTKRKEEDFKRGDSSQGRVRPALSRPNLPLSQRNTLFKSMRSLGSRQMFRCNDDDDVQTVSSIGFTEDESVGYSLAPSPEDLELPTTHAQNNKKNLINKEQKERSTLLHKWILLDRRSQRKDNVNCQLPVESNNEDWTLLDSSEVDKISRSYGMSNGIQVSDQDKPRPFLPMKALSRRWNERINLIANRKVCTRDVAGYIVVNPTTHGYKKGRNFTSLNLDDVIKEKTQSPSVSDTKSINSDTDDILNPYRKFTDDVST